MFTIPAQHQTNPARMPGQVVNRPAATPRSQPATLASNYAEYVARTQAGINDFIRRFDAKAKPAVVLDCHAGCDD